jgi:hypothetical protein
MNIRSYAVQNERSKQVDMKDFSKYLKYKSFDEAIHHIRRISLDRTADSELARKVIQHGNSQQEKKAA